MNDSTKVHGILRHFSPTQSVALPHVQGREHDNVLLLTIVVSNAYATETDYTPQPGDRITVTIQRDEDEQHEPPCEGRTA
jgi:hypothetical protein